MRLRHWLAPAIGCMLVGFAAPAPLAAVLHSVGSVTWHPAKYVGKTVELRGYVLVNDGTVVLFSDEAKGAISAHDLPVSGTAAGTLVRGKRYVLTGMFARRAAPAPNGSLYELQLVALAPAP